MKRRIIKYKKGKVFLENVEGASTQSGAPSIDSPIPVLPLQIDPVTSQSVAELNLHGIDTYKDIYQPAGSKIVRTIGKLSLKGRAWTKAGSGVFYSTGIDVGSYTNKKCMCNISTGVKSETTTSGLTVDKTICINNAGGQIYWKYDQYPDGASLKAAVDALDEAYIYYIMSSTTDEPVGELSELKQCAIEHRDPLTPVGYTRLEYLESSGTQYVNLNFIANKNTELRAKIAIFDNSGSAFLGIGTYTSDTNYSCFTFGTTGSTYAYFYGGTGAKTTSITAKKGDIIELQIKNGYQKLIIDSEEKVTNYEYGVETSTRDFLLFKAAASAFIPTKYRIYWCQIYQDGELVKDLIPCYNGTEAGFYDKVNSSFITKSGTGELIQGPSIKAIYSSLIKTNS